VSPVIELSNVSVRKGTTTILDSVSWTVNEGERWIVLGPNGAGKTTLLALIATLMHPTTGTVRVLGEELGAVDVFELRPRIGLASASLASLVPDNERVLDAVVTAAYGVIGRWREAYVAGDEARARKLLEQWGAGSLAERTYGTLSEGERKRVQIARALMSDPELLLLDEPAAGLDLGGREDLLGRLALWSADPTAAVGVLVTHHVEEVPAGTTHALLLRAGRVVAMGPVMTAVTSATLSGTFGLPLRLRRDSGRWSARAAVTRSAT
jgi:iron complex transport system ATP-binding protein